MKDTINRSLEDIYMHVASGRKFYPFAPRSEDITIEDIAHHLATAARWNGATVHPNNPNLLLLSVAEHSVYVSRYVEEELGRPDLALAALLHDAPEYVTGDMIRPLKYSPAFHAPFKAVEDLNERAVAERFNIPYPLPPEIKIADEAVCNAEYQQVVVRDPDEDWSGGILHETEVTAPYTIEMMLPAQARDFFMGRFWSIEKLERDAA
jgi:hypothetical protein